MIQEAIRKYLQTQKQPGFWPKAVLFDMDGVLFDSMCYHAQSWQAIAERHHLLHTPEDFYMFEGRTGESTISELFLRTFQRDATPEEKKSIYSEKVELFNSYDDSLPMTGAAEVVEAVRSFGLKTLIVTGSGQRSLIDKVNKVYPGVFQREQMVTAFDVTYGKPHPEPYLMGLKKAGVAANEAIVVENAPLGVEAAVAAGIFTIAVNTGPLQDRVLLDAGANLLYSDMHSLAVDWFQLMQLAGHEK